MRGYLLGIGALVIAAAGLLAGCGIKKNKEECIGSQALNK